MYSELQNKRADPNKRAWREDFFSFITWKMRVWLENESMVGNLLICYMRNRKCMMEKNSRKAKRAC